MRFTCCLNMVFELTKPIWALICLHGVARESVAALTDHFADAFVRENVARFYAVVATFNDVVATFNDVRTFDADAILLREI